MTIVVGMWHSLVARIVRDDEAAGSSPVIPTMKKIRGYSTSCSLFCCVLYIIP